MQDLFFVKSEEQIACEEDLLFLTIPSPIPWSDPPSIYRSTLAEGVPRLASPPPPPRQVPAHHPHSVDHLHRRRPFPPGQGSKRVFDPHRSFNVDGTPPMSTLLPTQGQHKVRKRNNVTTNCVDILSNVCPKLQHQFTNLESMFCRFPSLVCSVTTNT